MSVNGSGGRGRRIQDSGFGIQGNGCRLSAVGRRSTATATLTPRPPLPQTGEGENGRRPAQFPLSQHWERGPGGEGAVRRKPTADDRQPTAGALRWAALLLLAGCASAPALPPAGVAVADPAELAAALQRETTPAGPRQASFGWELNEGGTRVNGRGVVRYEAPERLRLDLFGPRGETYLAAGLLGETYHVPPAVRERFALPSPALLWSALGVVRPPDGSALQGASAAGSEVVLRYTLPEGREFSARVDTAGGLARLRRADLSGRSGVQETVEITPGPAGAPAQTRYRDWAAYRELILKMESVTDAAPFPASIWTPSTPSR